MRRFIFFAEEQAVSRSLRAIIWGHTGTLGSRFHKKVFLITVYTFTGEECCTGAKLIKTFQKYFVGH